MAKRTAATFSTNPAEVYEALVQSVLKSAPFGFAYLDTQLQFVLMNEGLADQNAAKPNDFLGKPLSSFFVREARAIEKMCRQVLKSGKPALDKEFSTAEPSAEFNVKYWVLSCVPVVSHHKIVGLCLIVSDISDRKKSSLQLTFHAHLLQNISDAIISTDLQYRILSWNKAAEQMYGWKAEEVLGKTTQEVLDSRALSQTISQVRKSILQTGVWSGELIQKTRSGVELNILASTTVFRDSWNEPVGVVTVNRDITDRKLTQRNLQKAIAAREEFMSIASHELKTPLTTIKAFMQLLQRKLKTQTDPTLLDYTHRIDVQINKLTQLIKDLLDSSKIEAGKLTYNRQLFSITDLVNEIVSDFQPMSKTHRILVNNPKQIQVNADRDRIGQVLLNFLANAIKYSPNADQVKVEVKALAKEVKVSVSDQGVGILPEHQQHVFERFFRAADIEAGTMPSLGLGLYISKEIITSHKGKIGVSSRKGKGSTFFFTIPLA